MAEGSVEECRYFLILAKDLGYGEKTSTGPWKKSAGSSERTPPPFWLLTPDFLDSHIPQGYQGVRPMYSDMLFVRK
jgi:hypothetical protein